MTDTDNQTAPDASATRRGSFRRANACAVRGLSQNRRDRQPHHRGCERRDLPRTGGRLCERRRAPYLPALKESSSIPATTRRHRCSPASFVTSRTNGSVTGECCNERYLSSPAAAGRRLGKTTPPSSRPNRRNTSSGDWPRTIGCPISCKACAINSASRSCINPSHGTIRRGLRRALRVGKNCSSRRGKPSPERSLTSRRQRRGRNVASA